MLVKLLAVLILLSLPVTVVYSAESNNLDLTNSWAGYFSIGIFLIAYLLVMAEEFTHLRKSKPVIIGAGLIWSVIAGIYASHGIHHTVESAIRHSLLEYSELMLFLLVAMTYINAMEERGVFDALRAWLVRSGFGFRSLFWITGTLAFFISPIADNLTTALLMCAVVLAVGGSNSKFITLACINIVVGANAGGAFSPFGDITTLMVWQKGLVDFWTFFNLFVPSAVNFLVPALIMHFAVPDFRPEAGNQSAVMQRGAVRIILLFLLTIITAVSFHNFLHIPPVVGMLTGLGYLQLFGFYLKISSSKDLPSLHGNRADDEELGSPVAFDVFKPIARAEWDTLLFFYGVVLCVGGLGFIGYLSMASELMYTGWGATVSNITVGVLSAIIDNIPVMYAVLTMNPDMSTGHWLLVTLTAGVGGSMLSIGSAAGVALMGQAREKYTFFGHLKWTPAIMAGYIASIFIHMTVNKSFF
jgi:NhaD family Na+/H+ antiporter